VPADLVAQGRHQADHHDGGAQLELEHETPSDGYHCSSTGLLRLYAEKGPF
jgi:hypothetical protein